MPGYHLRRYIVPTRACHPEEPAFWATKDLPTLRKYQKERHTPVKNYGKKGLGLDGPKNNEILHYFPEKHRAFVLDDRVP